jgi:hypothetical protein
MAVTPYNTQNMAAMSYSPRVKIILARLPRIRLLDSNIRKMFRRIPV